MSLIFRMALEAGLNEADAIKWVRKLRGAVYKCGEPLAVRYEFFQLRQSENVVAGLRAAGNSRPQNLDGG